MARHVNDQGDIRTVGTLRLFAIVTLVLILGVFAFNASASDTRSRGPHTCTTPCVVVLARGTQEDEVGFDYIGARYAGDRHPRVLIRRLAPWEH